MEAYASNYCEDRGDGKGQKVLRNQSGVKLSSKECS